MKNGSESRDALHISMKALPLPMDRDRKIMCVLRTNQIARFITVPSEKKIK